MKFAQTTESDSAPASLSGRLRQLPPLQDPTAPAGYTPRSILKVSPHISPRPLVAPPPGIQTLLAHAELSHYNYLSGSYQSPRKYDFVHEKTLIYTFTPSFKARYFAYSKYELPRVSSESAVTQKCVEVNQPLPPLTARPLVKRYLLPKSMSEQKMMDKKQDIGAAKEYQRYTRFPTASKQKPRPVVCVKDGESLGKDGMRTLSIDLLSYIQRYIGFGPGASAPVRDPKAVSLKNQAMLDLLETATTALKPETPFTSVFLVDGTRVKDLSSIPLSARVLIFSSTGAFQGLTDDSPTD